MRRMFLLSFVLAVFLISGCASRGPVGSWCGPLPEKAAVSAIAADAVSCLAGLYPPGHTTLHLVPAKSTGNDFAAAFENGLRASGFTLAPNAAANTLSVAYTLDALDEKSAWYLQLRLSDGKAVARAYSANGQPEAGQSRTGVEFQRSTFGKKIDKAGQKTRQTWDTGVNALTE